jgi:hypothetical protein
LDAIFGCKFVLAGLFLTLAGPVVDYMATGIRVDEWIRDNYDLPLIVGISVTSVLGVLVNITAYWAIKTTGAVTYQVLTNEEKETLKGSLWC